MLLQETYFMTEPSEHSSGTLEIKGQVLILQNFKIFIQRIKFMLGEQQYH